LLQSPAMKMRPINGNKSLAFRVFMVVADCGLVR
jgi:hypothetical protein